MTRESTLDDMNAPDVMKSTDGMINTDQTPEDGEVVSE